MTDQAQPQLGAPVVPPAPPSTPAEAVTRLEQLKGDPAWRDQFLAGNGPQKAEFHTLTAMIAGGDSIDKAMAGVPLDGPLQPSSHLTNIGVANTLREIGIRDEIIKDVIAGTHKVTRAEFEMTERWKRDHVADKDWCDRYMNGGALEKREMTLANIILSGGIRSEGAVA
jgi:hypothetical protein